MITLEPSDRRHTLIAQNEVLALFDRFFHCFDKAVFKNLLQRYSKSNALSRVLEPFDRRKRIVGGIAAACMVHEGLKPPDDFPMSFDSIFLIKFLTELYEKANEAERARLWGILRQVLDKNRDPRQNFFELAVGFIYTDFGATVSFTDIGDKPSKYEFLAEKEGYKTEVEVKTISSLSGHPLSAATLDSFVTGAHTLLDELRLPFSESHVRIVIRGKHTKHQGLISDLRACIGNLKRGRLQSSYGNVALLISRALPGDVESVEAHTRGAQYLLPEHLKQGYTLYGMLSPKVGRAFSTTSFKEPWNIATNLDKHLGDAFSKFSGKLPAVVWVCLSDASSFMTNPYARDIGFFRNDRVRQIINKYQSPERYDYPTGFVIASNFSFSTVEEENENLSLHGRYRFFRNKGLATEHFRFSPYHDKPF